VLATKPPNFAFAESCTLSEYFPSSYYFTPSNTNNVNLKCYRHKSEKRCSNIRMFEYTEAEFDITLVVKVEQSVTCECADDNFRTT